jgi:steroid delta-isomerase-like uncharacterized protein
MESTALDLTRTLIEEAFNKGNLEILDEIIHQDYHYRSPDSEIKGIDELKGFIGDFRTGFPDLNLNIDQQLIDADKTCTCFTFTGTHMGSFMDNPATKQKVKVHGIVVSRLQDNKIVEEWEILDMLSFLQQLGVVPSEM